jgi:mono/diheme cytochrome c family protein
MNRMGLRLIVLIGLLLSPCLVFAQKGDAKAGKEAFGKTCVKCHGADGNTPKEAVAKLLKVDKIPQLGSSEIQAKTDDELVKTVTQGAGKMKPVTTLSEKDVRNVIAFVRTLNKP